MNKNSHPGVAAVLALVMLALPGSLLAREKRGAQVIITLNNGHYSSGELIAVKPDSLLLLAGKDESVDIAAIRSVQIVRKSKAGRGAGIGALAGALVLGLAAAADPWLEPTFTGYLFLGVLGGAGGGLLGLGVGALSGADKTIPIAGRSEAEIHKALVYLSGKARIRDFK